MVGLVAQSASSSKTKPHPGGQLTPHEDFPEFSSCGEVSCGRGFKLDGLRRSTMSETALAQQSAQFEAIKMEYSEICKSYHNVRDMQLKLLTLIPIASGTAVSVVIKAPGGSSTHGDGRIGRLCADAWPVPI